MRVAALIFSGAFLLASSLAAGAQSRDETLADIRQELSVLQVEMQKLTRELSTTGGPGLPNAEGSALQRLDALEEQVRRLTARTEELEHRISRVVEDGTKRIGDLEFRLVELEGGDVGKLGETPTLGGEDLSLPAPAAAPDTVNGAELAVGERADFDAARLALQEGRNGEAVEKFARFVETYPGSPLSGEAHFLRGEALSAEGETSQAARAYLESFSGSPNGTRAPTALLKLGMALEELGQKREACVTLGEVGNRFPSATEVSRDAKAEMDAIGCQ